MNGLDCDVLATKIGLRNCFGDVGEVHWFLLGFENDEDLITNIARIDSWPLSEAPETVQGSEQLRNRRNGFDMVWMLII